MKGYRTLAFNAAIAVGSALLSWVAGYDWTQHVSPSAALTVVGVANIGLRLVTSTPVGGAR